ncbi:MAG: SMP-30/gluconolactonase/LRE family protein [Armatimonadetes bacterium]|nr:SMP-30/gluconolactonase/LRE family protein [Armatimonadota bacterium]
MKTHPSKREGESLSRPNPWRPYFPFLPILLIVLLTALPWINQVREERKAPETPPHPGETASIPRAPEEEADPHRLVNPVSVTVDAHGDLYITGQHRIQWMSRDEGVLRTIAGTGEPGASGDGGPAHQAKLYDPIGMAVDPRGSLYFASAGNHRVRTVDERGRIYTLAGTGQPGFSGDGGPARQARLNDPIDVAVDKHRNLYIADRGNRRIRKVRPDGTITTYAGGGASQEEGIPATQARLSQPVGVAVDRNGNLYIADRGSHRVRKVTPQGIITTVAGSGQEGYAGDGGPALQARLNGPHDVAVDGKGNLYIAGAGNHRVRKISPQGIITTVAGVGRPGSAGDNGPAVEAELNSPQDVAVDPNDHLYIADTGNHRIRRVTPAGTIQTVAGELPEEELPPQEQSESR